MADLAGIAVLLTAGLIILRGAAKGVDVYGVFLRGGKRGMETALSLLPALCAMTVMLAVMNASGLSMALTKVLTPVLSLMRLPVEAAPVLFLRPLTGSGSLTALQQVFEQCGVESRAGQIASVLVGSSETIFYTMTVYLGATNIRKLPWLIPVSLASYLIGAMVCGLVL